MVFDLSQVTQQVSQVTQQVLQVCRVTVTPFTTTYIMTWLFAKNVNQIGADLHSMLNRIVCSLWTKCMSEWVILAFIFYGSLLGSPIGSWPVEMVVTGSGWSIIPSVFCLYTAAVQLLVLQMFVSIHFRTSPSGELIGLVMCTPRCRGLLLECINTIHPDVKLQTRHKVPLMKGPRTVPPVSTEWSSAVIYSHQQ